MISMSKRVFAKWDEVIAQFAKGSTDARMGSRGTLDGAYLSKGNCFIEGDKLYSYGDHFTLAVRLDPELNAGVKFLINGDQSFKTTNDQRNECIRRLKDNIQVPFSALDSAGIIRQFIFGGFPDDFRVLHNQPDSYVQRQRNGELLWFDRECPSRWNSDESICTESERQDRMAKDFGGCSNKESRFDPVQDHYLGAVLLFANGRRYLSGLDANEPGRRHYFLTRLQESSTATTVQQAYEDLKPVEVREAIAQGLEVLRQGDVFFIESGARTKDLKRYDSGVKSIGKIPSSHYATEVRTLKSGAYAEVEFVRGFVTHKPDHAGPRHHRIKLGDGKQWYRAVRNTADGSWEAMGAVD